MATTEELAKDKRIKNFLKKFFKLHKQFKEVSKESKFDAILFFNKDELKSYHIVVCNEVKNLVSVTIPNKICKTENEIIRMLE